MSLLSSFPRLNAMVNHFNHSPAFSSSSLPSVWQSCLAKPQALFSQNLHLLYTCSHTATWTGGKRHNHVDGHVKFITTNSKWKLNVAWQSHYFPLVCSLFHSLRWLFYSLPSFLKLPAPLPSSSLSADNLDLYFTEKIEASIRKLPQAAPTVSTYLPAWTPTWLPSSPPVGVEKNLPCFQRRPAPPWGGLWLPPLFFPQGYCSHGSPLPSIMNPDGHRLFCSVTYL